jgi:hypothetical protein
MIYSNRCLLAHLDRNVGRLFLNKTGPRDTAQRSVDTEHAIVNTVIGKENFKEGDAAAVRSETLPLLRPSECPRPSLMGSYGSAGGAGYIELCRLGRIRNFCSSDMTHYTGYRAASIVGKRTEA